MGWLIVLLLAAAALAAIWWWGRPGRAGMQLIAAALLVGLAGYAWQGRPMLEGAPKSAAAPQPLPVTGFMEMRRDLLGQFDTADRYLTISEGYHRRGAGADAAGAIRAGLRQYPENMSLWIGYGYALAVHAGGVTPAVQLAFERAAALRPDHPAPAFFYARLLAETGNFGAAEAIWRSLLEGGPPSEKWREAIEGQLALVAQVRAFAEQQQRQAQQGPPPQTQQE